MGRCQISSGNGRYANLLSGSFEFILIIPIIRVCEFLFMGIDLIRALTICYPCSCVYIY